MSARQVDHRRMPRLASAPALDGWPAASARLGASDVARVSCGSDRPIRTGRGAGLDGTAGRPVRLLVDAPRRLVGTAAVRDDLAGRAGQRLRQAEPPYLSIIARKSRA